MDSIFLYHNQNILKNYYLEKLVNLLIKEILNSTYSLIALYSLLFLTADGFECHV